MWLTLCPKECTVKKVEEYLTEKVEECYHLHVTGGSAKQGRRSFAWIKQSGSELSVAEYP